MQTSYIIVQGALFLVAIVVMYVSPLGMPDLRRDLDMPGSLAITPTTFPIPLQFLI